MAGDFSKEKVTTEPVHIRFPIVDLRGVGLSPDREAQLAGLFGALQDKVADQKNIDKLFQEAQVALGEKEGDLGHQPVTANEKPETPVAYAKIDPA